MGSCKGEREEGNVSGAVYAAREQESTQNRHDKGLTPTQGMTNVWGTRQAPVYMTNHYALDTDNKTFDKVTDLYKKSEKMEHFQIENT